MKTLGHLRLILAVSWTAGLGIPAQPLWVTNPFTTANDRDWLVSGGGATHAPAYTVSHFLDLPYISVTSTKKADGIPVPGMTNFTGFWMADHMFHLPRGATEVRLTYSNFTVDDRGLMLLNDRAVVATGYGDRSTGSFVYTDGGSLQPFSSFAGTGPYGLVSHGTVTNGFNPGGANILRVIVNNTGTGVDGPNVPLLGTDSTAFSLTGTVVYQLAPSVSLIKALRPAFEDLVVGRNYQLQVSPDMATWTNSGTPFTATNTVMPHPGYWDVENWDRLYFRLQAIP